MTHSNHEAYGSKFTINTLPDAQAEAIDSGVSDYAVALESYSSAYRAHLRTPENTAAPDPNFLVNAALEGEQAIRGLSGVSEEVLASNIQIYRQNIAALSPTNYEDQWDTQVAQDVTTASQNAIGIAGRQQEIQTQLEDIANRTLVTGIQAAFDSPNQADMTNDEYLAYLRNLEAEVIEQLIPQIEAADQLEATTGVTIKFPDELNDFVTGARDVIAEIANPANTKGTNLNTQTTIAPPAFEA